MIDSLKYTSQLERTLVGRAYNTATSRIAERYENGPELDRLPYHNREHTDGVLRRARSIAQAIGLNKHDQWLVEIAAAFHDVVQEWEAADRDGIMVRVRKVGSNESKSAEEAVAWMREQKSKYFKEEDYEIVREAIMATVPTYDAERRTVTQDALKSATHPVVRAVALADIGSAGMEPDIFSAEGNSLFLEDHIGLVTAISAAKTVADIPEGDQQKYLERYRKWIASQVAFLEGRKALLDSELGDLSEGAQEHVRALFSHFDESRAFAQRHREFAESCTFEEMIGRLMPMAFRQTQ